MTTDQFLVALGYAETGNDWIRAIDGKIYELMGDGGQAFARWQVHPVWIWWAANKFVIQPQMHDTWDEWVEACIRAFYQWGIQKLTPVELAMRFHRGHVVLEGELEYDLEYAARFNRGALTA